ncbi:MAG: hypothetical protein ACAH95_16560 [Fimbriimonas sp.]
MTNDERSAAYDHHRREQRVILARNTTPEERVQWLEETLFFLWHNGLLPNRIDSRESEKRFGASD